MRLIFKILSLPIVAVLTLMTAVCSFALAISGVILGIVSVIVFLLALVTFFTLNPVMGAAWMAAAFLISPYGIPKFAEWLVGKIDGINCALKGFIFG